MHPLAGGNVRFSDVTLAILAGGQGRRMGLPKEQLQIAGKPILEYLLEHFAWPGPTLLITCPGRESPPGWRRFDRQVSDPVQGQGPLRGLLTAMQNCRTDSLVMATVDMPAIGFLQLQWLADRLFAVANRQGIMPRCPGGKIEPFPLACRKGLLTEIELRLAQNRNSLRSLAEDSLFALEDTPPDWDSNIWTNLNTPDDFRAFQSNPS